MATGNIDCPLPKLGSNCFDTIEFMRANAAALRQEMPPTTYAELQRAIDSNPALQITYRPIQKVGPTLDNKCSQTHNNNIELDTSCEKNPSCSHSSSINGNAEERCDDGVVYNKELSICVDSEEESGHSWRPSLGNSLSSDFFLAQPNPAAPRLPLPYGLDDVMPLRLPSSGNGNEPSGSKEDDGCTGYTSHSRHDVQSYVQSQKAELNILKYEVMNARRTINESRSHITNLNMRIAELAIYQDCQETEKLLTENAQLRLECQCYCMEVDFYLKGCSITAPLGEVDENFYEGKNAAQSKQTGVAPHKVPPTETWPPDYEDEDQEEDNNKWECHKCTFANHPAINCCEICQVPRLRREHPQLCSSSQDTCFCHPKEHNQSS